MVDLIKFGFIYLSHNVPCNFRQSLKRFPTDQSECREICKHRTANENLAHNAMKITGKVSNYLQIFHLSGSD